MNQYQINQNLASIIRSNWLIFALCWHHCCRLSIICQKKNQKAFMKNPEFRYKIEFLKYKNGNVSSFSISLVDDRSTIRYRPINDGCHFDLYLVIKDFEMGNMPNFGVSSPVSIDYCTATGGQYGYCHIITENQGFDVGSGSIDITHDAKIEYKIPYQCLELDTKKINLTLVGEFYRTPHIGQFEGIIRMDGLVENSVKNDIIQSILCGSMISYVDCSLVPLSVNSKFFKLTFSDFYYLESFSTPFILEIKYYNDDNTIRYTISDHIFKYKTETITDVIRYPQDLQSGYLGGLYLGNSLSFVSSNPLFGIYRFSLEGRSIETALFPIYGTNNSTTYLYNFPTDPYSSGATSLFHQNESKMVYYGVYDYSYSLGVNGPYNFKSIQYILQSRGQEEARIMNPPYGFLSGNSTLFYMSSSITIPSSIYTRLYIGSTYTSYSEGSPIDLLELNSLEIKKIDGSNFILRIEIIKYNGVKFFKTDANGPIVCGIECLVNGDIYNGIFEIIFDRSILISDQSLWIFDQSNQFFSFQFSNFIPNQSFLSVELFDKINELSFELESIDVTNKVVPNRIYFNFSENVPTDLPITFITQKKSLLQNDLKSFPVVWNSELKLFQSDFYVNANSYHGELTYGFLYNDYIIDHSTLPKSYQLNVTSMNMDSYGPIFKAFEISNNFIASGDTDGGWIGWTVEIEDLYNGFEYGMVTVRGLMDLSLYEIEFTALDLISGDLFNGIYEIEVFLNDTMGHYSRYSNDGIKDEFQSFNPFINHLDNQNIYTITSECQSKPNFDDSLPELFDFAISDKEIDVGSDYRKITIGAGLDILTCKSRLVGRVFPELLSSQNTCDTECQYVCEIDLPIGFGYPFGITVSVYGIVNRYNYFRGYSSNDLRELGFPYTINVTYSNHIPLITGNSKMNSNGGDLWIYGRCFDGVDSVYVEYWEIQTPPPQLPTNNKTEEIVKVFSSAILISNIKYTTEPYEIQLKKSDGDISSNIYIIEPWVAVSTFRQPTEPPTQTPTQTQTQTQTQTPTETPTQEPVLPTNSPRQCKNDCGGSTKGKCTTNGCVCTSPYIGVDCSSIIITIPQPKPNTTEPKTTIDIPSSNGDNNGGGETSLISFKSIINLVAIREITYDESVYKTHRFEKWISTEINEKTQQYTTTIGDDINNPTIVNVTLQWFDEESHVTFAGQTIKMNPSSVKYSIVLSRYPFNSALNGLQLVMSASLESTSDDNSICSVEEFGETSTGDDSNYLKIQIDDHSLYGRLLKRGIIDGKIVSISNSILDNEMNAIKTPTKSQSFIGIDIPHYSVSSVIDPDFSVLLDASPASDQKDSKCKSKSGLSSAQLAGIIIGSVGFAAVIGISVAYHFVRTKQKKTFEKSIKMKLNKGV
ncbi:hypothetical protein ACTA71_009617 [Dictyostelium dimigraforme]